MSHIVTIVYRKRKRKRRYSFFPWKVKSRRFPLRTIPPFRQCLSLGRFTLMCLKLEVINGKNTLFNHSCLSIYLDVANANDLPSEWSRYSHFCLAVVNQSNTNYSITRGLFSCLIFYSTRTGKCFFF